MKYLRILILLSIIVSNVNAQKVYEFLRLDTSPRAASLAGSFVSNTDDPNVIFYNPAGLYSMKNIPVSVSYVNYLLDISSASATASYDWEGIGRVGAAIQYISYGSFTEADEFGNKGGSFGASDIAMVVGYANTLGENFNYGINAKFIYSGIADYSSTGVAFDLGLQYLFPESNWNIGLSFLNMGSQLSAYNETKEDLPLDIRLGVSKKLTHIPLTFNLAFNRLNEGDGSVIERFKQITFGIEINLSKVIDVRLGYDNQKRQDYKLSSTAGLAGFHLGFGVKIKKYRVDYAFSSMGQIGSLHRFGISTSF